MNCRLFVSLIAIVLVIRCADNLSAQDTPAPARTDAPTNEQRIKNWLKTEDANDDGRIAADEASGLMKTNFARNDTDNDGFLDREELGQLAERLAQSGFNRGQRARGANAPARSRNQKNNPGRQGMSTEELLKRAPQGVAVEPDIAYRPGDSKAWRLDLIMPSERGDKPRPGLVFVHGGGWRNGDKRAGTFLQGALEYAQKGYVCITVNYRLVDEAPFPACVEDCKCAVRWLRAHADKYNLDPKRIGGFGNSAGAHLVAMLGLAGPDEELEGDGPYQDQSSLLQAVCPSATPADFLLFYSQGSDRRRSSGGLFAGPEETFEERARKASPVSHVSADAPPFLIFHGTKDNTVNVAHGDRLVEALKKAGAKDVTYIKIEGAGHGVFNQHADQTKPAMEAFFDRTIGPGSVVR